MEVWYGAALCAEARQRSRGNEKLKIAAIHAGITAGVALMVTLLQLLLSQGIGNTGGLSGLGMRSLLQTAETVLSGANTVLMPFWNVGFLFAALLWVREAPACPGDLIIGFRRFGVFLRLMLLEGVLLFVAGMFCVYASSFIYMLTPWAQPVMEFAQGVGMDMDAANAAMAQMDMATIDSLLWAMIPILVIWGVLCLAVVAPMLYRFRMAEFFLLDEKRMGALHAMALSARMLRKRRWKLFLLDLRFWWYYGLNILCLVVYSADLWLPMLGVALPEGIVTTLGVYVLYLLGLFFVQAFLRPQVQAAYALAYDRLLHVEPVLPKVQPTPKNLPWDEV